MKIKFIAKNPHMYEVALKPFPASQGLPEWWRDMAPYHRSAESPDGKKLIVEGYESNATFKKCAPMLDSLTAGYIIPLWSDVQVRQINGEARVTWRVTPHVFEPHGAPSESVPPPPGYTNQVMKFKNTWIPRTPKGYSVLVTQPFGYNNTPFYAIPAIIDSDTSSLEIVPPMWIREGFEGIVEKGTPMVQIIPFKRDSWTSKFSCYEKGEAEIIQDRNFNSTIVGHYIKNHWSKKTYK